MTSVISRSSHNIHPRSHYVGTGCQVVALGGTFERRFWRRVVQRGSDECWPWTGTKLKTGRGQVALPIVGGHIIRLTAPSVAWQLASGESIPVGHIVRHSCDNPNCCNPRHLLTGTQAQNIQDCIQRSRRNAFGRQKLHEADVLAIRARAAAGEIHRTIAADYGIARHTVSGIVHGHTWKHLIPLCTLKNVAVCQNAQAAR